MTHLETSSRSCFECSNFALRRASTGACADSEHAARESTRECECVSECVREY